MCGGGGSGGAIGVGSLVVVCAKGVIKVVFVNVCVLGDDLEEARDL